MKFSQNLSSTGSNRDSYRINDVIKGCQISKCQTALQSFSVILDGEMNAAFPPFWPLGWSKANLVQKGEYNGPSPPLKGLQKISAIFGCNVKIRKGMEKYQYCNIGPSLLLEMIRSMILPWKILLIRYRTSHILL